MSRFMNLRKTIIPEDKLEKKLRKKLEFDTLEQGKTNYLSFHLRFTEES